MSKSDDQDEFHLESSDRINPFHPGEILREEFLEPADMSQRELADRMDVYYPRVNQIVNGKRGISADTAARLARVFDTTEEFWMNLQNSYELTQLKEEENWEEIQSIRSAV